MLTQEYRALREVKPWRRFHVRLTLLYGMAILALLGGIGIAFYRVTLDAELDGLKDRILAIAVSLSATLDVEGLDQLRTPADVAHPAYTEAIRQFATINAEYPRITSIYVMRPTEDPDTLEVVVDYTPDDPNLALPGEAYDAREVPVMVRGLSEPAVEQEPYRDDFGTTLSGYAPLRRRNGEALGVVGLDLEAARLDEIRAQVLTLTLGLFGLAAALLAVLAVVVGRNLKGPLGTVMRASNEVAAGHLQTRVRLNRSDEFGLLGDNFNHMAEGLQEREFIRDTFGRYMSEEVARTLLESPERVALGGEERDVTVLLSDIRGYSSVSEKLDPTQVVELLNQYFGAMNEVIERHRGCVIEYLGDGILAVFGAPNDLPGHAEQAVRCAIAMRERLGELNVGWDASGRARLWNDLGFDKLLVRVGLQTGRVVAGNLGSRSRMKYAVTGDTVNVAARLEQLNKETATDILFTEAVLDRLPDDLRSAAVSRGEHVVKGRGSRVATWSI